MPAPSASQIERKGAIDDDQVRNARRRDRLHGGGDDDGRGRDDLRLASSAHSAWDAPMGIWAYIAGLNHLGQPANHIGPIILGLGGHMMNSMIIGMSSSP
jgi:hypothetical protein